MVKKYKLNPEKISYIEVHESELIVKYEEAHTSIRRSGSIFGSGSSNISEGYRIAGTSTLINLQEYSNDDRYLHFEDKKEIWSTPHIKIYIGVGGSYDSLTFRFKSNEELTEFEENLDAQLSFFITLK